MTSHLDHVAANQTLAAWDDRPPSKVTVTGYSDDLIQVDGAIDAEVAATYNGPDLLAFSDGTVLRVEYGSVWRIEPVVRGTADLVIEQAPEDDMDNYTDRATLTGDIAWVVLGREIVHARKDSDA